MLAYVVFQLSLDRLRLDDVDSEVDRLDNLDLEVDRLDNKDLEVD